MSSDKITIGLTIKNRKIIDKIMDKGFFKDQIDAAKFSLSVAIKYNVKPGSIEGADTVWNVGSFDREGELRDLITALYPNTESPYRLIEFFINAGLEIIGEYLEKDKYFGLEELMKASD